MNFVINNLLWACLCLLSLDVHGVLGRPGTHRHGAHRHGAHRHGAHLTTEVEDAISIAHLETSCQPLPESIQSQLDFAAKTRAVAETCPTEKFSLVPRGIRNDDYSCSESKPCSNGACCAKTGYCGYGPASCGTNGVSPNENCWSNCDAKAECGRYAKTAGQKCPLNVCCSQFGFCGMTEEFCKKTDDEETSCQSNCDQPGSGGSDGDVQSLIIGYYEAWNHEKNCIGMRWEDIPVNSLTHLNFAFGYITPGTFEITGMDDLSPDLFSDLTKLKSKNTALKTMVALGGWTFNDNNTATQPVFSDMVSSEENRSKFIDNLFSFLRNYGFDGVDFDWEYPGAGDRGGQPDDGVNFSQLLKELQERIAGEPTKYIVSFTAPTSYWYLRHFDLAESVKHVDFVNVMSYDLHGVWDADNPIGSQILAHTNLTEIKEALNLFWRNDIPANKINLGLGFYGRSFQLANPACNTPGCLFKGGAAPGPCTANTGTLSYNEIMQVIEENNITPYYDKENEVKYITWKGDQWISFDDQETFQAKIKFANDLGLGGLLIWAVDLDTPQLDALSGVIYPKRLGEIGAEASTVDKYKDASEGDCRVTECGTSSCRAGEIHITNQPCTRGDFVTGEYKISALCCPLASAPDPNKCTWRGNANFCNGQCHPGEVALESNKWGPDDGDAFFDECWDGLKFYCCEIPDKKKYNCGWTDCGEKCDSSTQTTMTWAYQDCWLEPKEFCCDKEQKWENCAWHGKPGSCFDNHCDTGHQVALATSYDGEGDDCGWKLERKRTFCCDPPKDESVFSPVPLEYLFEHPPEGDTVDTDFELELDPTFGGANSVPFAEDPDQAAFGFVVMASPEEIQVSLDKRSGSDWEVFNCLDSTSIGEHTVKMVCTDHSDNSDCYKIGLGQGVPGTILEMPRGCGPGKYAVAKTMTVSGDQSLPHHLVKRGISPKSTIYDLTFDYDFKRVPRDNANTQMRIDYSNEPGYWDRVVDEAARKKRKFKRELHEYAGDHKRWLDDAWMSDHQELKAGLITREELHARWFGSDVVEWLKGLISGVAGGIDVKHSYKEDFKLIFLREKFTCDLPGNGEVQANLDASATVHVEMDTNYGFTLVTTLDFPPNLSKSYLYFRNRGKVDAKFEMSAVVSATFKGETVLLSADQFGATFTVPGILTIGPNFKLVGAVEGGISLAGSFQTQVKLVDWDVRQTFPVANNDWNPESDSVPNRDGTQQLLEPTFEYNVAVDGFITAHVKPTITFGIEWSKTLFDLPNAAVNLVADGYVTFYGSASTGSSGSSLCYGVKAGSDLYANVDAPDLYGWKLSVDRYEIASVLPVDVFGPKCPISSRAIDADWLNLPGVNDTSPKKTRSYPQIFEDFDNASKLNKRAQPYGPVIKVPKLTCPGQGDAPDDPYPCPLCASSSTSRLLMEREDTCIFTPGNSGESTCSGTAAKRSELPEFLANASSSNSLDGNGFAHSLVSRDSDVEKRTEKTLTWDYGGGTWYLDFGPYPSCNAAATGGRVSKYWTFDNPDEPSATCNTDIYKLNKDKVTATEFQTDHVYEAQTIRDFLEMLRGKGPIPLPTAVGYAAASDEWVSTFLIDIPGGPVAPLPVAGSASLQRALSTNLGGNGNEGLMAILHKGINNKKGKMFEFANFDYTQSGIRATKRYQREVAGVFLYMSDDVIWPKFTATSLGIEQTLLAFDNAYNWGSQPGDEIVLGTGGRAAGRGLRDLYCWFIDQYMNRVETKYQGWSTQAKNALNNDPQGQSREGQSWIDGAMTIGALKPSNMKFPSVGTMPPRGQTVTRSRYGLWDLALGNAGPF